MGSLRQALRLARLHPGGVVALGDLYRRVPQQDGDALDEHAIQEQFHCQRIPEPMRVASLHPGDFAQATESAAPVSRERLFRTDTCPEPVALADAMPLSLDMYEACA